MQYGFIYICICICHIYLYLFIFIGPQTCTHYHFVAHLINQHILIDHNIFDSLYHDQNLEILVCKLSSLSYGLSRVINFVSSPKWTKWVDKFFTMLKLFKTRKLSYSLKRFQNYQTGPLKVNGFLFPSNAWKNNH